MSDSSLRLRPLWLTLGVVWVALVVWLTLMANPPALAIDFEYLDKLEHLSAYAFLQGWFMLIYPRAATRWLIALVFVAQGITLEVLQGLGGVRYFELWDMAANSLGVGLALWLVRPPLSRSLHFIERRLFGAA